MEIFVAVVEAGQITRAANRLLLSKSAVSYALTNLEKYLGFQLINRANGAWELTDAGSNYFAQCKNLLAEISAMENEVRQESQTLSGLIRLSVPTTYGSYSLMPILAQFMKIHPNISIELNSADRFEDMIEKRIDISFRYGEVKERFLVTHKVGETELMMCASPAYLEKFGRPITHQDLKHHKCIKYTPTPQWEFTKDGRRLEFIPKDHILTDNGETIREFCINGQGLAFLPSILTDISIKKGRLVKILTDYDCGILPIQAIRIADNHASSRVVQLLNFTVRELRSRQSHVPKFVSGGN